MASTATTKMTIDGTMIRRHLELLFAPADGAPGEASIVTIQNGNTTPSFFPSENIDAMVEHCVNHAKTVDVYVSGSLIDAKRARRRGGRARGKEEEVTAVCAFRFDLDVSKPGSAKRYPTQHEHLDALAKMPIPATMLVNSGSGGIHPWWVFEEPVVIEGPKHLAAVKRLSEGWLGCYRRTIGGMYDVDGTAELVRVLRVAGTWHHKHGAPVALIGEPRAYCLVEDFKPYVANPITTSAANVNNTNTNTGNGQATHNTPETWKTDKALEEMLALEVGAENDGSNRLMRALRIAAMCDLSDRQVVDTIRRYSRRKGRAFSRTYPDSGILHRLQKAKDRLADEAATSADEKTSKAKMLWEVQQAMKAPYGYSKGGDVLGCRQMGVGRTARYSIVMAEGQTLDFATTAELHSKAAVDRIMSATLGGRIVLAEGVTQKSWRDYARRLQAIAEIVAEENDSEIMVEYIRAFLAQEGDAGEYAYDPRDVAEGGECERHRLADGKPTGQKQRPLSSFVSGHGPGFKAFVGTDGLTYIRLTEFYDFLGAKHSGMTRPEIKHRLTEAGFAPVRVKGESREARFRAGKLP